MKQSIPALFLCFTLIAGCSTQSTHQDTQAIKKFTHNFITNQQIRFNDTVISIKAFGDNLKNLRFTKGIAMELYIDEPLSMGDLSKVQTLMRKNELLKIRYAQLN